MNGRGEQSGSGVESEGGGGGVESNLWEAGVRIFIFVEEVWAKNEPHRQ
jgi:hypothetical protein